MPGASPQSGMTETPSRRGLVVQLLLLEHDSVLPPRSEKWQPASTAARAIGPL